jgi:small-conductance mechanosensitive channel
VAAPRRGRTRARTVRQKRARRRGLRTGARVDLAGSAQARLRRFRGATILAVALTGLLLLIFAPDEVGVAQVPTDTPTRELPDTLAIIDPVPLEEVRREAEQEEETVVEPPEELARAAAQEARDTVRDLWVGFYASLPKVAVALLALLIAWLVTRVVRRVTKRLLRHWERSNALSVLLSIAVWLLGFGIALSVLAGDIRALVGSLGLVGLALSWALQSPIESFTAWLINSFRGYYRVGDRIAVGEVFGDVHRIDPLTTTVWEIGSPHREGFVAAEQPTGRLVTFPNNEILAGTVVNLTRDFPYVWDELTVPVANRSDLAYAGEVVLRVATEVLKEEMAEPAERYEAILQGARLELRVARAPEVFFSLDDSWTNVTIRYLVDARRRRFWGSALSASIMTELNRSEHADRIISVFPRRQIQFIGPDGKPRDVPAPASSDPSGG